MVLDALLAWAHFLAIFFLIVVLTAEAVLLRPGLSAQTVGRLALYDRLYLVSAVLVLATGLARLMLGAKGVAFLMPNPWFHAKIALFVVIGLCSIPPTLAFLRWKRQAARLPGFVPDDAEIRRARRWVMLSSHLLILLPLFATLMARGIGL
ncbi:hypothetical protein CEG14_07400 [Bordetella genomosp. 1]|uniref:DUF2214 domain-containing protein n=1 Tax=Bordetella genomosp. 1 TaxID=1395607 RepID=A0A261SPM6_9BORD|nr:DUF2214 family protein [Bordetella genomosp. 1]MDQ8034919.1 DUF2214 family protein [Bordetella sp.]OZI39336.1 hypothetical protein CEG14_07400 [Bordetella genomosp. 1]OZI65551.1 hypothetical protein CAL27_11025 [Bordetella genomosp. 1]